MGISFFGERGWLESRRTLRGFRRLDHPPITQEPNLSIIASLRARLHAGA